MIEANEGFPEHFPQNTVEVLRIELELLEISSKSTLRLAIGVEKTLERCVYFFKRMRTMHNKCHTYSVERIQEFPDKDEHLKYLQDRLCEDELSIQQIEGITEKVIKYWIAKASNKNFLLEYLYRKTPPKMAKIKSQLVVHEVTVRLLEPLDYKTIVVEADVWGEFIGIPVGPP